MSGETVGFIGLGIMGRPMALNLLRRGHRLVVHSRSPGPVEELVRAGAISAGGAEEVGAAATVVITMLPDTHAVEDIVRGILAGMRPGG
ncbi:MAG: NAD(P)-binding domain-containing protein, partial [Chloroflexota bacterium]|nr:NAD(P)-binding domain-containing protein [Chloroflexota bacterium]